MTVARRGAAFPHPATPHSALTPPPPAMKRLALLLPLLASVAAAETTPRGLVVDDLTLAPPASWFSGSLLLRVFMNVTKGDIA